MFLLCIVNPIVAMVTYMLFLFLCLTMLLYV